MRIVVLARPANIPTDFRYVPGGDLPVRTLFLVDLATGSTTNIASVSVGPSGAATFSSSKDGRRLLVAATRADAHGTISSVDVEKGAVTTLYEDVQVGASYVLSAVISADGMRYALADAHSVRVGDTGGGTTRLLVDHDDPSSVGGIWRPIGWSSDGAWLAIARATEGSSEVAIVDTTLNAIRRLGGGSVVAWRPQVPARSPELLVAGGVSAFGGSTLMYTYDVRTNRGTVLLDRGSLRIGSPAWHPSDNSFLYTASQGFGPPADDVFVWELGATAPRQVPSSRKLLSAWWSSDGSKIYALATRQDALASAPGVANFEVLDLSSGRVLGTICRGDPRAACP